MADQGVDHSLNGESRVSVVVGILSAGCVITTAVVTLRIYTRTILLRTFGVEDAFMIAAQFLAIGSAVAIGLETKYGLGTHTWLQPPEYYIPYMKSFYSSIVLYNVAMCLVKISILLQYRRIFASPLMQWITAGGVAFVGAWTVMIAFLLTLICMPVAAFWDDSVEGRCLDSLAVWYVMASFNLITDVALFVLPLPVIRSLQLPRRQKWTLIIVFGLGLFTCVTSILRIQTLKEAANAVDPNWENVEAAYWSFLEVCTSILAASLPTLRPVLSKILPRIFASSTYRNTTAAKYHGDSGNAYRLHSTFKSDRGKPESMTTLNRDDGIDPSDQSAHSQQGPTGYDVSVSGGRKTATDSVRMDGGIRTTTVITQRVSED